jgi:DNA invertase Pin-like site-specific DNA recombinase
MSKHTAVYVRVSTEGLKGNREQSTEMQVLDIKKYLESKGITDFEVYEDKASGTKKDRPALKKLMNDCRQGKVKMVVVYKLDRLFRSLQHLMETIAEFQKLEVEFVSTKDAIDMSSASGRLLFHVLGAFSEFEAAVIKERVISGLANARSKGVKLGRPFKKGHSVVQKMKDEGSTVLEISNHTGLSTKTIYRTLSKGTGE